MSRRGKQTTSDQTILYDKITKNETKIQLKLVQLKKEKATCYCKHYEDLKEECESYDTKVNYYQKFWKLFLLNELCYAKLQASNSQLNVLEDKISEVNNLFEEHDELLGDRGTKRNRRQAFEIDKQYSCPYRVCYKSYASEVALNLHIKQKHNGGNKSQRLRQAQRIEQARQNNLPTAPAYINFPPGFLQQYRRNRQSSNSPQEVVPSEQEEQNLGSES